MADKEVLKGWYIMDDGTISDQGLYDVYRLVKFVIDTNNNYLLTCPGSGHGVFAKYTDDTYETVDTLIASSIVRDYKYQGTLEAGYYAISWAEGSVFGDCEVLLVSGTFYNKVLMPLLNPDDPNRHFGTPIQNFSNFSISNGGWTKISDNEV